MYVCSMKTVYSDDLNPLVKELRDKVQTLLEEYQIKSGFSKNEIRFGLFIEKETSKVAVDLGIDPELINFVPHGHQKGSDT